MRILYTTLFLAFTQINSNAQSIQQKLDHYLTQTSRFGKFNGTVLVAHKGEIILNTGYGYRNIKEQSLNDSSTIYRIGSISKPITATAILYLYEHNKLSLNDPLSKYIAGFSNGDNIRIENLLTHSSGIIDYLNVKQVQDLPDGSAPIGIEELIAFFINEKPVMPVGKKFSYSNSNYILLAYVIEKVTGKKYEDFVRRIIFEPAGMNNSGFDYEGLSSDKKATGYFDIRNETPVVNFDSTYAPGCGSMYTSAADLYKFYKALYSNKIISDSIRELSFVPRFWKYAYGWFSYNLYDQPCISHAGGVPGFIADFHFFPKEDLCIVMLTNNGTGYVTNEKIASIVLGRKAKKSPL